MFGLGLPKKDKINDLNLNQWVKLGDILYNKDKLTINYTCYKDLRKDPFGRLYIIATEGEIVKIGGSQDKGGIESTINAYLRGDIGNSESMRNYAVCKYIKQQLDMGSDVEVWFLPLPIVEVDIPQGVLIGLVIVIEAKWYQESFLECFEVFEFERSAN